MSKKLLGLFAGIVFTVSVMVVPVKAEVPDIGDLSKYSNEQLVAMILEMLTPGSSAETDTTTPQTGSSNWVSLGIPQGFQFNTNLKLGMTSNDVKYLQIMLNSDPDTAVAITGAGSKGNETTYFGGLTQQAVVKFQEKYASTVLTPLGLTKGTGLAGAGTRVKLNEMLTQGVSDTPVDVSSLGMIECVTKGYAWNGTKCYDPKAEDGETPVVKPVEGAGLEVALASDSPATSLVTGQSAAPLAKFVLTNKDAVEAKITRVELQRIGVSADATLANVYLFQGLTRLTDSAAISQGKIAFNNPNGIITVPAGSSVVLTVASDIDTGTSGQTIGISLNSVQSNVEVKALPVRGHVQTVADAELAKVTVGTVVPESEDSVNAGTANYTVFQAPLTVSKRAVNLKAVTLKAIGSAPFDSFENVQLYVNGVEVGSPIVLTSEGMATFILDTPHEIQSGSAILEVRADIVKGSSRNFSFSLQNAADLIAVDTDYNVYTQVAGVPKTTALITINEGTVSVSQDSTFDATTVTGGVSNAVLAKYSFKAFGENVKVSYLDVESSVNLDNVSIYVNGAPVTSNVNYTGSKLHFSLGSSLIIPAGEAVSVEVRGDTKVNGEKLEDTTNIKMTLVPYTNNAQGVSSSKMITVPSIKTEGQELTVGSGELTISKRSGVTDSNISPNTDNQRIGAFTIQAGDSEAVRVNNFNVNLTGSLKTESLSNLYLKYGSSETTPRSVQTNNNFTAGGVVIPAGESMNVDVYADVHSVLAKPNTGPLATFDKTDNSAAKATATLVVAGEKTAGGTATVTINGISVTHTIVANDEFDAVATAIATLINANINVNGYVIAEADGAEITLTSRTIGTSGSFKLAASVDGGTYTIREDPGGDISTAKDIEGTDANATITLSDHVEIGDLFTVVINGTTFTYNAQAATPADVYSGLKASIESDTEIAKVVSVNTNGSNLEITSKAKTTGLTSIFAKAEKGSTTSDAATVITTLGISATGVSSNATLSVNDETGQTMTTATATLNTPTLSSTSAAAQFVLGDSEAQAAKYNFIATGGKVVVNKLKFTVANPEAVHSITIDGKTQNVSGGALTISGLNIEIPETRSGKAVIVKIKYNKVGIGGIEATDDVKLTLNEVEYKSGNATREITGLTVGSGEMYVVAGHPNKVEIKKVTDNLRNGEVKVAEVTITPTGGPIKLQKLPIQIDISSGVSEASLDTGAKFIAKSSLLSSDVEVALENSAGDKTASKTLDFSTGVTITKAETFSIYVTNIKDAAKDNKLTTKLGAKSSFQFTDIEGNTANINGSKLLKANYDESSVEISY